MKPSILLLAAFLTISSTVLHPHGGASVVCPQNFQVSIGDKQLAVPYCSSRPINKKILSIDRIVVAIHSSNYDAERTFNNVSEAVSKVEGASRKTLIFAPQFLKKDHTKGPVPENLLYWAVDPFWGSSQGINKRSSKPVGMSSYEVLEKMLNQLTAKSLFPNVKTLVLIGHSAGAQMVQRFAATSAFEQFSARPKGITMRYIVMSPSSYVYFDKKRVQEGTADTFRIPRGEDIEKCTNYNNYGYGLGNLYSYHIRSGMTGEYIIMYYAFRNVSYLIGKEDRFEDTTLSIHCASLMQGKNRLERALIYFNYLKNFFGDRILETQRFEIVPGVGHSERKMLLSDTGLKYLFW